MKLLVIVLYYNHLYAKNIFKNLILNKSASENFLVFVNTNGSEQKKSQKITKLKKVSQ